MTDAPEPTTAPEDQRAVTVVKERLVAHSSEPMWDSAAFDHMGRVAAVMAESGLCSDTLLNNDGGEPAPAKTVVARMLMIAHMARECGANPLMFLSGCSRIGKKIHLEGKLVNAIVRVRTGVNLKFEFGAWDTDHIEFPPMIPRTDDAGEPMSEDGKPVMMPDPTFFHGIGERLAIRVSDPNDPTRHVDGSVGLWKTDRKGSPWTSQGNWRRQLRYRGAPEWARAYEPGAVLGLYSDADQDIDDLEPQRVTTGSGLAARLSGTQEGNGFNAEDVAAQTGPKKRKTKAEKLAEEALAAADAVVDAQVEEIPAEPTPTDAPEVEPEVGQEAEPDPAAKQPPTAEHAAPGEVYLLDGDGYNNDKRRPTYKDGARHSTVHKDTAHKLTVYVTHAPAPADPDEGIPEHMRDDVGATSIEGLKDELSGVEPYQEGDEVPEGVLDRPTSGEADTGTDAAPDAEPEPASSAPATPASEAGAPTGEDSGQSPPADGDGLPAEYATYIEAVDAAETWKAVKQAISAFYSTDFFKALPPEKQNKVRATTWEACLQGKEDGTLHDLPDHADDISAFRLWLETVEDPDAIIGTKAVLERQPQWQGEVAAIQGADQTRGARAKNLIASINNAVDARLRALS